MTFLRSKTLVFACLIPGVLLIQSSINAQEAKEQIASKTANEISRKPDVVDQPVSSKPLKTSLMTRLGVEPVQTESLSLNDAIRQALSNNNDIEVARNDVKIAESTLRSLLGFYDPAINVNPSYSSNVVPQPNIFSGADASGVVSRDQVTANTSFSQFIKKGGGSYSVFFNNNKVTTSSLASTLNPSFRSSLGVSLSQPLFRNRKIDLNRRQIKIQRKLIAQSDADFRRQTIEIISNVQRAYWDLVFALKDQQNRSSNLNLTKENLRQVEARIAAGVAAPLQKAEVSTELANRESDLLMATEQVSRMENTLKQLILKDPSSPRWSDSLLPTDTPVFSTDVVGMDSAIKDAIANRPELKRLKLQREINKVDREYFRDQLKPQVDFTTTFSLDGLAGTAADGAAGISVNPVFVGGLDRSLRNVFEGDYRTFSTGITFSFPIRNKAAKANLATARFQQQRIEAQSRSQEQSIVLEVRNAVQALETARQRVLTSRRARESAEKQLAGERDLLRFGRSTNFLLFQRENALTNARNAEIRSETDYNKALADIQKATSTTFIANDIVVDSPGKTGN